jgi:hypothetical protein
MVHDFQALNKSRSLISQCKLANFDVGGLISKDSFAERLPLLLPNGLAEATMIGQIQLPQYLSNFVVSS